jgi:GNAT superfamily N-acetyltransferase
MKHSLQENRLPQTYGIFVDNKIVGMYQFAYEDLSIRPDIYPWLANVYIDEAYRNKGLCRKMMETVKENAEKARTIAKNDCKDAQKRNETKNYGLCKSIRL